MEVIRCRLSLNGSISFCQHFQENVSQQTEKQDNTQFNDSAKICPNIDIIGEKKSFWWVFNSPRWNSVHCISWIAVCIEEFRCYKTECFSSFLSSQKVWKGSFLVDLSIILSSISVSTIFNYLCTFECNSGNNQNMIWHRFFVSYLVWVLIWKLVQNFLFMYYFF